MPTHLPRESSLDILRDLRTKCLHATISTDNLSANISRMRGTLLDSILRNMVDMPDPIPASDILDLLLTGWSSILDNLLDDFPLSLRSMVRLDTLLGPLMGRTVVLRETASLFRLILDELSLPVRHPSKPAGNVILSMEGWMGEIDMAVEWNYPYSADRIINFHILQRMRDLLHGYSNIIPHGDEDSVIRQAWDRLRPSLIVSSRLDPLDGMLDAALGRIHPRTIRHWDATINGLRGRMDLPPLCLAPKVMEAPTWTT